jgi:uncharacterized membrane protein YjgN (DUF898 family)
MALPPPLPSSEHADAARTGAELDTLATLYAVTAGVQIVLLLLVAGFLAYGVHEEAQLNAIGQSAEQAQAGVVAIVMLSVLLGLGLVSLALKVLAARALRARRQRLLCNAVAVLTCLEFPLGTVLGVWTLLVLQRADAPALFRKA